MGRLNLVDIVGYVQELPRIKKNNETGEYESALAQIVVYRNGSVRYAGDGIRGGFYSKPVVYAMRREMIMIMDTWKPNDIVRVKGVLATKYINKTSFCTVCGSRNRKEGSLTYVNPTEISLVGTLNNEEESKAKLKEYTLSSNTVMALGNLGHDPKRVPITKMNGKKFMVCQYPVVLNRLYFEESDPVDKREDFPWVKSYGKHCDSDYFRLKKGSTVLVDGFLQARKVLKHAICSSCGEPYDWQDSMLEIVPYEVEYLMNTRTLEEAEEIQLQRQEQSARDIEAYLSKLAGNEDDDEDEENKADEYDLTDENDLKDDDDGDEEEDFRSFDKLKKYA